MSREFVQAHQRDRLLEGMVRAVEAKGYLATSVADVLAIARVSRTTFYEMFRDKEDCFLACYDLGTGLVTDAIGSALAAPGPWRERVQRVFERLFGTFVEHPQLARVCMVDALAAGPVANERYRSAVAGIVALVENDMLTHDDVPKIPTGMISFLVGGCSGLIYEAIVTGRTTRLREMAGRVSEFWMAGFMGYDQLYVSQEGVSSASSTRSAQ